MYRSILAVVAVTLLAVPAAADHHHRHDHSGGQLQQYAAQIRSQMALVRSQTDATFEHIRSSRLVSSDIYRELDDLCRELDRLEELAARPIISKGDFRRVERAVERLDDQAHEVEDAVHGALADPRRFAGGPVYLPTTRPAAFHGNAGYRGVRLVIGGGKVGVDFGATRPVPYVTARPVALGGHGRVDRDGEALCAMTDSLRLMTRQLVALTSR